MHKEKINGKEFLVADTLEEALVSWFGEEAGKSMAETLRIPEHHEKCVYIFAMDNDTTKIGVTVDVEKRKSVVEHSSGAEVVKYCNTELMDAKKAFAIENTCHKHFKDKRLKGEFFRISFDEACAELQKHAEITFGTPKQLSA